MDLLTRSMAVALARRELLRPALYRAAAIFFGTGIAAAILSDSLPDDGSASSSIIHAFHQTVAVIASVIAVFRTIDRVSADADSDWLMQHTAAGGSRALYILTVPLCVSVRMLMLSAAGATAFAVTRAIAWGGLGMLQSVVVSLPLNGLMIVSAAMFGAAVASVTPGRTGVPFALVLLAAPWAALLATLTASHGEDPVSLLTTLLSYPPPRLSIGWTAASVSYAAVYTAAMSSIAVVRAHHRVCRRT